jgi:hypothetical protein
VDVRLDPRFPWHPKSVEVGPYGRDLFVAGLCYATAQLTDGFIPRDAVDWLASQHGRRGRSARALVDAGFWHPALGGYVIHDFDHYQLTRAELEEAMRLADDELERERASNRERQRRFRERNADVTRYVTRDRTVTPSRAREDGQLGVQGFSRTAVSVQEDARAQRALSSNSDERPNEPDGIGPDRDALTERRARPALDPPAVPSEGVAAVLERVRDADEGTPRVLEALRRRGLPPAAFFAALEALEAARPVRSEAAYVVGALQTMLREERYS